MKGHQRAWVAVKMAIARRAATPETCPRCGTAVLCGPDGDVAALMVMVDAAPVDAVRELRALAGGRRSYDRIGAELHWRTTQWQVRPEPAGCGRFPVHVDHECEA